MFTWAQFRQFCRLFLCLRAGDSQDRTGDIMFLLSFHVHTSVHTSVYTSVCYFCKCDISRMFWGIFFKLCSNVLSNYMLNSLHFGVHSARVRLTPASCDPFLWTWYLTNDFTGTQMSIFTQFTQISTALGRMDFIYCILTSISNTVIVCHNLFFLFYLVWRSRAGCRRPLTQIATCDFGYTNKIRWIWLSEVGLFTTIWQCESQNAASLISFGIHGLNVTSN